jgi:hypothetical protein
VDTVAALTDTETEPGAGRLLATSTATSTVPSTTAAVNQAHQGTVLARAGPPRPGTPGMGCAATTGLVPANRTIMRHSMNEPDRPGYLRGRIATHIISRTT